MPAHKHQPRPGGAGDPRIFAPATQRNRAPILDILARALPRDGSVLEIASGSGEHGAWFVPHLPAVTWQPSDPDPECRRSIAARVAELASPRFLPPLDLDVTAPRWPIERAEALVCINMVHIAPWAAAVALIAGAARILPPGGILYLYGPFMRGGRHTAASNADFDVSLRARNPDWGLRDVEAVTERAEGAGLEALEVIEMPANNLSLLFRRSPPVISMG